MSVKKKLILKIINWLSSQKTEVHIRIPGMKIEGSPKFDKGNSG